jgi:hypothetical protein
MTLAVPHTKVPRNSSAAVSSSTTHGQFKEFSLLSQIESSSQLLPDRPDCVDEKVVKDCSSKYPQFPMARVFST